MCEEKSDEPACVSNVRFTLEPEETGVCWAVTPEDCHKPVNTPLHSKISDQAFLSLGDEAGEEGGLQLEVRVGAQSTISVFVTMLSLLSEIIMFKGNNALFKIGFHMLVKSLAAKPLKI